MNNSNEIKERINLLRKAMTVPTTVADIRLNHKQRGLIIAQVLKNQGEVRCQSK